MYIDNPTIMISDNGDGSYVVFGQMQYFMGDQQKAKQTGKAPQAQAQPQLIKEVSEEEEENDQEEVSAEGLQEDDINELINYANCSRNKAIKLLRSSNGDLVDALSKI